jgi:hypothetical protein
MRRLYHNYRLAFWLVVANAALYALFMFADLSGADRLAQEMPSSLLKYVSVCVCFAISLLVLRDSPYRRDARLQVVIFAFTLVADFLVLLTDHFTAGIFIFCGAHMTAAVRYGGTRRAAGAAVVAGVAFAALLIWYADLSAPLPYAILIVSATAFAFQRRQARVNNLMSRLGMSLFILCDVNVLLWNLRSTGLTGIPAWTGVLMWAFYLPGQTILALSAADFEGEGGTVS